MNFNDKVQNVILRNRSIPYIKLSDAAIEKLAESMEAMGMYATGMYIRNTASGESQKRYYTNLKKEI